MNLKRVIFSLLAAAVLSNLVWGLVALSTKPAQGRNRFEVLAKVGKRTVPVREGSVITQGTKNEEGLCVFDQPHGMRVIVHEGDIGPMVRTRIDDDCREVVESIVEESDSPPPQGTTIKPTDTGGQP